MPPRYAATTVTHGTFFYDIKPWQDMVLRYSAATVTHGMFFYAIRPLRYWLKNMRYPATMVSDGICVHFYFIFYTLGLILQFCVSVVVVWRCQTAARSQYTKSTVGLQYIVKFTSKQENLLQITGRQECAANVQPTQARDTPPDVNYFITR